uniref:Putative replicase n=1 Tax=Votsystermes virus TaxID=2796638 RepID=A0A7T7GUX7_9VIRU|nr:putative replicase [Votsystermes virus]
MEQLPADKREVIVNNTGLSAYLAQVEQGRKPTPRSWLYESVAPDKVLQNWLDTLHLLGKSEDTYARRILSFELEKLKVWGPQGGTPELSKAIAKTEEYYTSPRPHPAFADEDWKRAIEQARLWLFGKRTHLRPASYNKVVDDMRERDTLNTNSGWPDFKQRSMPEVKTRAIADAASGQWRDYPAILLYRQYFGKLRQVWMYPMATNLVEGSFTQPIMAAMRKQPTASETLAPWIGFDAVREVISQWYGMADEYIFGGDFTGMDIHMRVAQNEQVYSLLEPLFSEQDRPLLRDSILNSNNIGLVVSRTEWMPPGVDAHGLASGSNWTQLPETIFQVILNQYIQIKLVKRIALCAIGDDSASRTLKSNHPMAPELVKVYESVGMEANLAKQSDSISELTFLQRLFQRGYLRTDGLTRAVYPTIRALESSVWPERYHSKNWDKWMFCIRQYMILENCIDHPLFEEFVRFIVRGQEDLIPFAKFGGKRLEQFQRQANLIPNLNPSYNQEKRTKSLAEFEGIRIASQL